MAGDWIKICTNLDQKPEVFKMATILGTDELSIVGRLYKLWAWADQHTISGDGISVTNVTLDRITNTPGFADALRTVGWLGGRDGHLSFPNFERHNGQTAKDRALTKDRMRRMRYDNVTPTPSLEKRREEYKQQQPRREKGKDFELASMSPEAALADVQRHHPDIDCWNEYLKLKQLCAKQGTKPTWRQFLAWLKKASPIAKAKKGDPQANVIPIQNGTGPIPVEQQTQMAKEFAAMRQASGI